jgi:hypothetical protein
VCGLPIGRRHREEASAKNVTPHYQWVTGAAEAAVPFKQQLASKIY